MAEACDVAAHVLARTGAITSYKLQKLVYYSQAWCLAWNGRPLFVEGIQAWQNGPVVRSVYNKHHGAKIVSAIPGDPAKLSDDEREQINEVVRFYGQFDGDALSDLTHREPPWRAARAGLPRGASTTDTISLDAVRDYHTALASLAPRGTIAPQIKGTIDMLLALADDEVDLFLEEEADPMAVLAATT